MRPYLDKASPTVWKAASAYSAAVGEEAERLGLTLQEAELIKVRVSQLNGCAFCLDLHARDARGAGITPQMLDLLPAWRESDLYSDRERAVLAIAEATTRLPLSEEQKADLSGAEHVLGEDAFVAAEWVALTINTFNRISILSDHPVRRRDSDGSLTAR